MSKGHTVTLSRLVPSNQEEGRRSVSSDLNMNMFWLEPQRFWGVVSAVLLLCPQVLVQCRFPNPWTSCPHCWRPLVMRWGNEMITWLWRTFLIYCFFKLRPPMISDRLPRAALCCNYFWMILFYRRIPQEAQSNQVVLLSVLDRAVVIEPEDCGKFPSYVERIFCFFVFIPDPGPGSFHFYHHRRL